MRRLLLLTVAFLVSSFITVHAQSDIDKLGWRIVHTPMAVGPSDVFYPSEDTIYCQSTKGNWESTDAGNTWQLLPPLPRDGELVTALTGNTICAFWNNIAYRSTDEGKTWDSTVVDFSWPRPAPAISQDTAILTSFGYIARTTDQGRHWLKSTTPNREFSGVNFCNARTGLVWDGVGAPGPQPCLLTDDAAATWDSISIPVVTLSTIAPASRDTLIYVREGIWRSTNRGVSWTNVRPSTPDLYLLAFRDGIGLLASGWGYILRTTNAGYTWDSIYAGEYIWDKVAFQNTEHAKAFIIFGTGADTANVVLLGSDAGATLSVPDRPVREQESSFVYPNPTSSHSLLALYVANEATAVLHVIDILGREIIAPRLIKLEAGMNQIDLPPDLGNGQYRCVITGRPELDASFTVWH